MTNPTSEHDWEDNAGPSEYLVDEATALDNSLLEKIIGGTCHDSFLFSEDEDIELNFIDWDGAFNPIDANKTRNLFVPGLRPPPPYPKLSVLTEIQHHQLLKVVCAKHPHILEQAFFNKPTDDDLDTFDILKPVYEKEQKEYIEWAKSLWVNEHYVRALCPKPEIEVVYEAEFKMKAHRLRNFPTCFDMAAQIPLECLTAHHYDIELIQTLLGVNKLEIPLVELPLPIPKKISVIEACSYPEPCDKHPYQFILPNENSMSMLPITELHRELALYAAENGTRFIASENAVRCLVEFNRHWTIPVSVCQEFTPDRDSCNVVVLDSEFSIHKEPAMTRTYKAMRHLLENTLIPPIELEKMIARRKKKQNEIESKKLSSSTYIALAIDELHLSCHEKKSSRTIFEDKAPVEPNKRHCQNIESRPEHNKVAGACGKINADSTGTNDTIGVTRCACTDTRYELPPKRSFKKWRLRNTDTFDNIDVIVHCAHKARSESNEVIVEPIPEYQLEMGGGEMPSDKIRALVLSLMFRENAELVNVRLDGCTGEIVTIDTVTTDEFISAHSEMRQQVLNIVHTTLYELQGLLPGHYLLQHTPSHGPNAILHVARLNGDSLKLEFAFSQLAEPDEFKIAKTPPTIAPVLMPLHKFRKMLPCAFTPFEDKKPPKPKYVPQAMRNPKRKARKNKKIVK